jgi:triosephosphate isomerase
MRQQIVAGNWKMNTLLPEGAALAEAIVGRLPGKPPCQVVLAVPFTHLRTVYDIVWENPNIGLGAQNCHQADKGAYTGEVSAAMLVSAGVEWVILGHSERRQFFGETDALLASKVDAALSTGLRPIFCCGEPLDIRESAGHEAYVAGQLERGLFHLDAAAIRQVVIAYEPIWAIGTGRTASAEQAQEMHASIRTLISRHYGDTIGQHIPLLYGGSCNPQNASTLFALPDVDGGLIGGASLKADDFLAIVAAIQPGS